MIDYFKGIYGINLLFRVHGSALYKGSLLGIFSTLIFLAIELRWNDHGREQDFDDDLDSPYAIGVLVSSVTFLIIFRANYGYQRYWEACGALHHFMSKWMDATMHTAVFHMQNKHYDGCKPPNFFDHDELNKLNLTRARTRHKGQPSSEHRLKSVYDCQKERGTYMRVDTGRSDQFDDEDSMRGGTNTHNHYQSNNNNTHSNGGTQHGRRRTSVFAHKLSPLPDSVLDGQWDIIPPTPDNASSGMLRRTKLNSKYFPSMLRPNQNFGCRPDGQTPPLFLQELAHLSSLACAVALSTLRNDIEHSESPLDMFIPGAPWPESDPDKLPRPIRNEFQHSFHPMTILRHWLGRDRLPEWRSEYNAARPLLIVGGVSNAEIRFLQKARGPHAKAQLALAWLKEFIIREHLDGSLGEVHGAIISRMVQFLSDGMMFYHQARKIMYIPFPFPHAQLSAFFTAIMIFAVPFLMDQYTNMLWIGSIMTFMTVTCLVGLHEVARELENPFRNVPNEIPLCTLHAMYNETLMTMFSGYNPDSFWDAEAYQDALQAMAMGKVYQKNRDAEDSWAMKTKDGILEMPTLDETKDSTATVKDECSSSSSSDKKRRTVTFSASVEADSDVARELREILSKQAFEIKELGRLLDSEENGCVESKISSPPPRVTEEPIDGGKE